jgi:hypothetical protein
MPIAKVILFMSYRRTISDALAVSGFCLFLNSRWTGLDAGEIEIPIARIAEKECIELGWWLIGLGYVKFRCGIG